MNTIRVWANYKQENAFDKNIKSSEVVQLTLQASSPSDAIAAYIKWVRRNRKDIFMNITSDGVFYEIIG